MDIPAYFIEKEHEFCGEKVIVDERFTDAVSSMEVTKQYTHSNILEYLTEKKAFKFDKHMKK